MKKLLVSTLLLGAVAMFSASSANAQAAAPPKGDAAKGKARYTAVGCYQCHGYLGQGSNAGAKLAPKPLPLAAMTAYVRKPSGVMPPVTAKVVSDQDMADMHAFLSSIPPAPDPKSLPLLNQ